MIKTKVASVVLAIFALLFCASCGNGNGNGNAGANAKVNEEAWVDLGLPSGLLWATCNLGATSPEEYGDYYAWGETTTKSTYEWSTYRYCWADYAGRLMALSKYNTSTNYDSVDNLTTLLPEDDAATQMLGGGARIPTAAEWVELRNNTTAERTTMNGVNGCKFTAPNGNSIFLPAAGYRTYMLNNDATNCYYWSASLYESEPSRAIYFWSRFGDTATINALERRYGYSVRAVRAR